MLKVLLLIVALYVPHKNDVVYVDMIEVNTICDEYAFPIFTQYIFWDWYKGNWVVVDWKMNNNIWIKSDDHFAQWDKELRELCDKNKTIDYVYAKENKYRGKFSPIPGVNFPEKRLDYWRIRVYPNGDTSGIEVKAKIFRETWTQTDPERDNRHIWPENLRKKLRIAYEEQAN